MRFHLHLRCLLLRSLRIGRPHHGFVLLHISLRACLLHCELYVFAHLPRTHLSRNPLIQTDRAIVPLVSTIGLVPRVKLFPLVGYLKSLRWVFKLVLTSLFKFGFKTFILLIFLKLVYSDVVLDVFLSHGVCHDLLDNLVFALFKLLYLASDGLSVRFSAGFVFCPSEKTGVGTF